MNELESLGEKMIDCPRSGAINQLLTENLRNMKQYFDHQHFQMIFQPILIMCEYDPASLLCIATRAITHVVRGGLQLEEIWKKNLKNSGLLVLQEGLNILLSSETLSCVGWCFSQNFARCFRWPYVLEWRWLVRVVSWHDALLCVVCLNFLLCEFSLLASCHVNIHFILPRALHAVIWSEKNDQAVRWFPFIFTYVRSINAFLFFL